MQINLVQSEIQEALTEFITNQGIDISGKRVVVTLTAGRGEKGHSAQIEIMPKDAPITKSTKKGKGAKAAAAEVVDDDKPAIDFNFED